MEIDYTWQRAAMPQPTPLENPNNKRPEFPIEALNPLLMHAAIAIADRAQCPIDFAACSLLAVSSLATQGHVQVITPKNMITPLSLHFLTVARSGERKTTADNLAIEPVLRWQKQFADNYEQLKKKYKQDNDIWEHRYKKITCADIAEPEQGNRLIRLGAQPTPPLKPIRICGDPTVEGLVKLFLTGHPSIAVFSSEGGQFIGGYGMNKENRLKTAAWLSDIWDAAKPIDRVRGAKDEIELLHGRRLAFHLLVQPDVASELYGMKVIANQGWLQRLLMSYPDSLIGTRFQKADNEDTAATLEYYNAKILDILNWDVPTVPNKPQEVAPYSMQFHSEAIDDWVDYADSVELYQQAGNQYESITGFASKMLENATRIAGVMTMIEYFDSYKSDPSGGYIRREMFVNATTIVDYFAQHLLLMVKGSEDAADIANATKLLEWLQATYHGQFVDGRSIERLGPGCLRGSSHEAQSRRETAIALLEKKGWIELRPENAAVDGLRIRRDTRLWKFCKYTGV